MSKSDRNQEGKGRIFAKSAIALLAGFAVAVVLSLATDFALHLIGFWPALEKPMTSPLLLTATVYRTLYAVLSAYVVARLAPYRPLEHALVGGLIGLVLSSAGAVATWNKDLGPHWYPVALIVLALPSAWVGGKLRLAQLEGSAAG